MSNIIEVNCRGLACPLPVLNTKKALEQMQEGTAVVIVDNDTARENVSLFARNAGHQVEVSPKGGEYYISIKKLTAASKEIGSPPGPGKSHSTQPGKSSGVQLENSDGSQLEIRQTEKSNAPESGAKDNGCVYFFTSNILGQGSPDLGQVIMKSLMVTLAETDPAPQALLFLNTGVMLACQGSPVLQQLEKIAGRGAVLISCGTCLDYYKLKEKLAVGRVGNMYDINSMLSGPHKVITVG